MFEYFLEVPGTYGMELVQVEENYPLSEAFREIEQRVHACRLERGERAGNPGAEGLTLVVTRLPVGALARRQGHGM